MRLLAAAEQPNRHRPGIVQRDRLVLLALVSTGLRRVELIDVAWAHLDLDGPAPSLLVQHARAESHVTNRCPPNSSQNSSAGESSESSSGEGTSSVACEADAYSQTCSPTSSAAAPRRAGREKHVTAQTLRRTSATWLRQAMGDTRLVA